MSKKMTNSITDLQVKLQNYLEVGNYRMFYRHIIQNDSELLSLFQNNKELYEYYKTDLECLKYNVAFDDTKGCIADCNSLLKYISELVK